MFASPGRLEIVGGLKFLYIETSLFLLVAQKSAIIIGRGKDTSIKVLFNAIQEIKAAAKKNFLSIHNYKVMTKKRAVAFLEYLKKDNEYNLYNELLKMF